MTLSTHTKTGSTHYLPSDSEDDELSDSKRVRTEETPSGSLTNNPQPTRQSDVNYRARSAIGRMFGESIKPESFEADRKAILETEFRETELYGESELQQAVNKRLESRPDIDEIALHIERREKASDKSVCLKPEKIVLDGPDLPPEVEQKILQAFAPGKGKQALVDLNGSLRYLRANNTDFKLEVQTDQGMSVPIDVTDRVKKGLKKAHAEGKRYTLTYILNKPEGQAKNAGKGKAAIRNDAEVPSEPLRMKDSRSNFDRKYGDDTIRGQYAGRFFLTSSSVDGFVSNTTDDSKKFFKALDVKPSQMTGILQDTVALFGTPVERFRVKGSGENQECTVEMHMATAGPGKDLFYFYVGCVDEAIVSLRTLRHDSDHTTVIPRMKSGMFRANSNFTKIAAAGGKFESEQERTVRRLHGSESRNQRAVTFNSGTAYERMHPLFRLDSDPPMLLFTTKENRHQLDTTRKACGYNYGTADEFISAAIGSATTCDIIGRTPDYEVERYECSLPDAKDPKKAHDFDLYVLSHEHPTEGKIVFMPRVVDPDADQEKTVKQMLGLAAETGVLAKTIRQHMAPFTADVPGLGSIELQAIGQFVIEPKQFEACLSNRRIPTPAGITDGDFVRKALQLCGQPEETYTRQKTAAAIDRYQVSMLGGTYNVLVSRLSEGAKNLVLHVDITPADEIPDEQKKNRIFSQHIEKNRAYISAAKARAGLVPDRIAIPEQETDFLFNLDVSDKTYVCEPAGDFISLGLPFVSKFIGKGDDVRQTKKIVEDCQSRLPNGAKQFLHEALRNAKLSTDPADTRHAYQTAHYTVRIYDTTVLDKKFKLAVASPSPFYQNLVVATDIRAEGHGSAADMVSTMQSRTLEKKLDFLQQLTHLKAQADSLPEDTLKERVEVPEHLVNKMERVSSAATTAPMRAPRQSSSAKGSTDDMDIDEPESDVEGAANAEEGGEAPSALPNVFESYAALSTAVAKEFTSTEQDEIQQTITRLANLDLRDGLELTPRSQHEQLIELGKLWLVHVRHALSSSAGAEQRKSRPLHDDTDPYWQQHLRTRTVPDSDSEEKVSWQEEVALVRPLANELKNKINPLFARFGVRIAVLANAYEPVLFMNNVAHTYNDIVGWAKKRADGGVAAARQMVDFMEGRISLDQLDDNLRMLAMITHFAEAARGYTQELEPLKQHLQEIANIKGDSRTPTERKAALAWGKLADAYVPATARSDDTDYDFEDNPDNRDDAADMMKLDEYIDPESPGRDEMLAKEADMPLDQLVPVAKQAS